LTDDGDGEITLEFGGDVAALTQTVKNVSGGELTKGTPVHAVVDGASGNLAYVIAARADTASAMPATFVLNETLADEAEGEAIITGLLSGVDTDAFAPGDVVYVGETGGYTNVKPTGTNLIQNLGIVLKSHPSNGSGIVYGAGRSNDVPNLADGKFFIGSTGNTQESAYGLPTTDPSNNETLVYNSTSDAFEAGYPISDGQQSVWTIDSTYSRAYTTTGAIYWGGPLTGTSTYTQACRAGLTIGLSVTGNSLLATPVNLDSEVSVSASFAVTAPSGFIGSISAVTSGFLSAPTYSSPAIIGDGTTQNITLTGTTGTAVAWQLTNSLYFQLNFLLGTTCTIVLTSVTITVDHA
jgi:hypothetical protein